MSRQMQTSQIRHPGPRKKELSRNGANMLWKGDFMYPKLIQLVLALLLAGAATATAADFRIDWYTIDAGGATFTTGGSFELSGTIGQHDAMPSAMTGGGFTLVGGFWPGAAEEEFCPGDLDGDGEVGLTDLALLLGNYGLSGMQYEDGDLDGDGDVDLDDLAALLAVYGTIC